MPAYAKTQSRTLKSNLNQNNTNETHDLNL